MLKAFDGDDEFDANESEENLDPEAVYKIQQGKRMKKVNVVAKNPLEFGADGLSLLCVSSALNSFISRLLRDPGAMHYLDWRARAKAMGQDLTNPIWGNFADDSVEDQSDDFTPNLCNMFADDLRSIKEVESKLAHIITGTVRRDGATPDMDLFISRVWNQRSWWWTGGNSCGRIELWMFGPKVAAKRVEGLWRIQDPVS